MIAVFDAMGTLFDLSVLDEPLSRAGVPSRDAWFQRLLHSAQTSTITGAYRPFRELAESTLRTAIAQPGHDPAQAGEIAGLLAAVPAHPDAGEALDRLAAPPARETAIRVPCRRSICRSIRQPGPPAHPSRAPRSASSPRAPRRALGKRACRAAGRA